MSEMNKKWPAVMIDIETLGTADDAVILEIGAVAFDREGRRTGSMLRGRVDVVSQPGRVIDAEALRWWMDPSRREQFAIYMTLYPALEGLDIVLAVLVDFFAEYVEENAEVWTKGDFDLRILNHALEKSFCATPWKYHQARELRTVMKLAGLKPLPTAHGALEDAQAQVGYLFEALDVLKSRDPVGTDYAAGWNAYRQELLETMGMTSLPVWEELTEQVRECWCVGVQSAGRI